MKYIILFLSVIAIIFLTSFIFSMIFNGKESIGKKLKLSSIIMLGILPLFSFIGTTLFLFFKAIVLLLKLNIDNFKTLLIAIIGVLIVFVGDFISKNIVTAIAVQMVSKKYSAEELSQDEMIEIVNEKQKGMKIWTVIIMFVSSLLLYLLVMKLISVQYTWTFLAILAIISTICYEIIFRLNLRKQNQVSKQV